MHTGFFFAPATAPSASFPFAQTYSDLFPALPDAYPALFAPPTAFTFARFVWAACALAAFGLPGLAAPPPLPRVPAPPACLEDAASRDAGCDVAGGAEEVPCIPPWPGRFFAHRRAQCRARWVAPAPYAPTAALGAECETMNASKKVRPFAIPPYRFENRLGNPVSPRALIVVVLAVVLIQSLSICALTSHSGKGRLATSTSCALAGRGSAGGRNDTAHPRGRGPLCRLGATTTSARQRRRR